MLCTEARNIGLADGEAAASHVIDGNTSLETCRSWIDKINNCDFDGPDMPNDEEVLEEHPEAKLMHKYRVEVWWDDYLAGFQEAWEMSVLAACYYQVSSDQ